jgi:hypothetical protein
MAAVAARPEPWARLDHLPLHSDTYRLSGLGDASGDYDESAMPEFEFVSPGFTRRRPTAIMGPVDLRGNGP